MSIAIIPNMMPCSSVEINVPCVDITSDTVCTYWLFRKFVYKYVCDWVLPILALPPISKVSDLRSDLAGLRGIFRGIYPFR